MNDMDQIREAVWKRILAFVGSDVGLFDRQELIFYGPRSAVFPCIKLEWHPERKVYVFGEAGVPLLDEDGFKVPLSNPRWRSILVQSTIDHITQFCLLKEFSEAETAVVREGDAEKIIKGVSLVGVSRADDRLGAIERVFDKLRVLGNGDICTSDVSGMDWSVSGLASLDGYHFIRGKPFNWEWAGRLHVPVFVGPPCALLMWREGGKAQSFGTGSAISDRSDSAVKTPPFSASFVFFIDSCGFA